MFISAIACCMTGLHDMYCLRCRILYVARPLLLKAASEARRRGEERRGDEMRGGRVTSHLTLLVLEGIGGSHVVTDSKSQSSTLSIPDKNDNMSPLSRLNTRGGSRQLLASPRHVAAVSPDPSTVHPSNPASERVREPSRSAW